MSKAYVSYQVENNVGYVEFFHPSHNALPSDVLTQLCQTIDAAGQDESAKVLVLKSGGERTFCAGASFDELLAIRDIKDGTNFFSGFARLINSIRKNPKLIIGRVQGKAVGGGVGIAAATDFCMATIHSEIKLSELNIGIGPFVIEPALKRKVGLSATSQLSLEPQTFFSAEWAKSKGLYTNIFETTIDLDTAIAQKAQELADYNPNALLALKTMLWAQTQTWDELLLERAKISGELVLSAYTKEQLSKYK